MADVNFGERVKNNPLRIAKVHAWVRPIKERLLSSFIPEPNSGCWIWIGGINQNGYGTIKLRGRSILAHRLSFNVLGGKPIPDGLVIDHLCRLRCCVNPQHLEPVTHVVNVRRGGESLKTHCPKGHPYDTVNTLMVNNGTARRCRTCHNLETSASKRRKRAQPK